MRCSPFLVVYPACFVKAFFCTSALCNIWPASSSDDYMPLPGSIIMCRDRMWAKIGIRAARSGAPITSSALVVGTLDLALPPPSLPCPSTDGRSLPHCRSLNECPLLPLAIRLPSVILQMIIIGRHALRPLSAPNGGGGHALFGTAFSPLMFVGTFPSPRKMDSLACATPFVPSCSWPARFRVVPLATSAAVSMFLRGSNHRLFSSLLPLLVEYIVHEFSPPHTSVSTPPPPPFTTDLKRSDFGRWTHRSTIEVVGCPPLSRRMDGLTAWPPPKPCTQETHRRLPSD